MKFIFKIEKVLITVTSVLCTVLILKLLYSLRTILPWRVNCWFCNNSFWMKFLERNSWTCPKCDQYNGFTKDGDYNKPLFTANEKVLQSPKVFRSSPPNNGLCKMCNINQQLKVAQLANYVPMNDKNFDEEIDAYRMQLEKAYRLCSPCKKVLQTKLHKEKEVLLGTKLLEARTPEKKAQKHVIRNRKLLNVINSTLMFVAGVLLILISLELYTSITKNKNLLTTITNIKDILADLMARIISIIKVKIIMTFPMLEKYLIDIPNFIHFDKWLTHVNYKSEFIENYSILIHEAMGSFGCFIDLVGYFFTEQKSTIATDSLWIILVIICFVQHFMAVDLTIMSLLKLLCTITILFVYRSTKTKSVKKTRKISTSPNKMKNLTNCSMTSMVHDEDVSMETDDDVSLSQYGLNNSSESSSETVSPPNKSFINSRSFNPRSDNSHSGIWTTPLLNSTFCVNPVLKSPSSVSETIFVKPNYQKFEKDQSFRKYQKLTKDDSDSDLDESISSLYIGSPKKAKKNGTVFSLRKFTATPNFVAPTALARSRPLISPSKLGHSTSWVAGGYWGSEGERQISNIDGSRSSSQSSGFESQASSINQHNVVSQPPSREDSVFGEPDRSSVLSDRFQNCNMSNFQGAKNISQHHRPQNFTPQGPQNFSGISSPVFPQMQYNGHVHIPQPRFAQQNVSNVFAQQQLLRQNSVFKAPGCSGLIRLPQSNSSSR